MDCKYSTELMSKDVLLPTEKILLESHIKKCPSCNRKFLFLNKTISLLENAIVLPPGNFTERVMARIKSPVDRPSELTGRTIWQWWRLWRLVPATVIPFVIIIGLIFLWRLKPAEIVITFRVVVPRAQTVVLAGDFNSWDTESIKLKKQDGFWQTKISLPRGRYQYVFIIDGKTWMPDPSAKSYVDSGYGTKNSILDTTRLKI